VPNTERLAIRRPVDMTSSEEEEEQGIGRRMAAEDEGEEEKEEETSPLVAGEDRGTAVRQILDDI